MDLRREIVLLTCIAVALLVLATLATNVARLLTAVGREVHRAQVNYLHVMGDGEPVARNALLLGQCLRSEMLRNARDGFVHPDTWAVAARIRALPECTRTLPPVEPSTAPVLTGPRLRPIVTSWTAERAAPATPVLPPSHVE